jgi:hypothetical protein
MTTDREFTTPSLTTTQQQHNHTREEQKSSFFVTMTMAMTAAAAATWPDAAPLAGEELIFSISCGNSHLHWATHFGEAQDYNPDMFWR